MNRFILLVIFCYIVVGSYGNDVSKRLDKVESMIKVLTDRLDKQQQACQNVQILDHHDNDSTHKTLSRNTRAADPVIAFTARISGNITPIGTNEIIVYDSVLTNYGNAYDSFVGRFQAPVSGVYHFVATIMSYSSHYMEISMLNDNSVLCKARASASYNAMGTCVANVHLTSGSDVWIQHNGANGDYARGSLYSSFAGHLIQED